jgi:hypothetical protein
MVKKYLHYFVFFFLNTNALVPVDGFPMVSPFTLPSTFDIYSRTWDIQKTLEENQESLFQNFVLECCDFDVEIIIPAEDSSLAPINNTKKNEIKATLRQMVKNPMGAKIMRIMIALYTDPKTGISNKFTKIMFMLSKINRSAFHIEKAEKEVSRSCYISWPNSMSLQNSVFF